MSNNIEDIYPLSPMQKGMLFHSLLSSETGVYVEQTSCIIQGAFVIEAFRNAWESIIQRHSILRSAFMWQDVDQPLQIVYKSVEVPFRVLDWQSLPDKKHMLEELSKSEVDKGFNLEEAPLIRFVVIKTDAEEYYFIWTQHHIIFDGWSAQIIIKEVFETYNSMVKKNSLNLNAVRPYRDYITWLLEQDLAKAEEYWKKKLAGLESPASFLVGKPLNNSSSGYAREQRFISKEVSSIANDYSRKHKLTLNTIMQGLWALILRTYCRESDVIFGSTVSGRPSELRGVDSTAGLFINTLPVRIKVGPESELLSWLVSLQLDQAEQRKYEYCSLTDIQGWSQMPRELPLFESIIVFENYPITSALSGQTGDLVIKNVKSHSRTNYPLTIVVGPGERISIEIAYNEELFSNEFIQGLFVHFQNLLADLPLISEKKLKQINILSNDEQNKIINGFSKSDSFPLEDICIPELFESIVMKYGGRIACKDNDLEISYRDLNERANMLANYLILTGITSETIVALCIERSVDMIIAVMAVIKTGAAYLSLDPSNPVERIHYMLNDSGCGILLTKSRFSPIFESSSLKKIYLDDSKDIILKQNNENISIRIYQENLAYIIYTSGSTGNPKGTMLSHKGVINLVKVFQKKFNLQPGRNILQFSSFSFDSAVAEIFPTLLNGATLFLTDSEVVHSTELLKKFLKENRINFLILPPSALAIMPKFDLPDLDTIIAAGEALSKNLLERWLPGRNFYNGYGPTEATVCTTLELCSMDEMSQSPAPPIGRPISNFRTYILDRFMHPVPIGAPGELYIGGIGLARGYLSHPEMTAEKFIPDPFGSEKGGRLYRTGDMARYLKDGRIEFLGRMDTQVKLRGFRIEMQEIESQMMSFEGVKEAVVILREDRPGDKRLVGYVVTENKEFEASELQTYLKGKLPDYMVPSFIMQLDQMPLTHSGKIDRRKLPIPALKCENKENEREKNITEEILANIWADILHVEIVGNEDSFFELGGHSLLATQLISRIRDAFNIEIPFSSLFKDKKLSSLAKRIDNIRNSDKGVLDKIVKYEKDSRIPLSFAQQRLWFLNKLQPGMTSYNIPSAIKIQGEININYLYDSISTVVKRHEVLRTVFSEIDGKPVQIIKEDYKADVTIVDFAGEPERNKLKEVYNITDAEICRPFNLKEGPLFRMHIIILSKEECVVLLVVHHIIADGWSMGILIHEIASVYESFIKNKSLSMPELNLQYSDYSIWQNRMYDKGKYNSQINYWKEHLSNIPPVSQLPTDFPRKPVLTTRGNTITSLIEQSLVKELSELSRKEGTTLFMTLFAAFNVLLHKYTAQQTISVGVPIAGRVRTEIEDLIGLFVNNLVLVTEFSDKLTFRELLNNVRTASLEAYANQDVPFEKIVEAISPVRDLSHSPLFQVMFVFQNFQVKPFEIEGLKISPFTLRSTTSNFDLSMILKESEEGVLIAMEYNSELFEAETIEGLLLHYKNIINSAVSEPETFIEDLAVLSPSEKEKILYSWNDTLEDVHLPQQIAERFNETVKENPSATAVALMQSDGTTIEELTYSGINLRAERLASFLMDKNFGKEKIAAVIMDRSVEMIVSIMAVLKSGGAFLPVDPAYPEERILYMLEDSGVSLILTQTHLCEKVSQFGIKVICIDSESENVYLSEGNISENRIYPDNLAYVIYTSGSTGLPKGTLISHIGVINLAEIQKKAFNLKPGRRVMQFSSLSFDASIWEIFMTLLNGAALYLCEKDTVLSGEKLREYLKNNRINVLTLPPSVLSFIPSDKLGDLDVLITAGEAASWNLVEKWSRGRKYFNAYGPTEATVCTTLELCSMDEMNQSPAPPIGRPISNFRTYILDRFMHPVPVGAPGELYIGGIGLARGYLSHPEMTAEKFIPDPFGSEKGGRLYRTGDMARYLKDGRIEFLGRMDTQVKLRGFRIEMQEIESQMMSFEGVKEAVVILREDRPGDKRLVGYVVTENKEFEASELQTYLKGKLPDYMVPSFIMQLDQMPLTHSGKIDRIKLSAMNIEYSLHKEEYLAPRTPVEKQITEIAAGLLKIGKIGIYDNFFEMGGHSLLASQLVSRIRENIGVEIPLRLVFEKPVFADLSFEIETLQRVASKTDSGGIKSVSRENRKVLKSELGT